MRNARSVLLAAVSLIAVGCSPPATDTDAGDAAVQDVTAPTDVQRADVQADVTPPPANARCTGATTLTAGTPVTGQDTTLATQVLGSLCYPTGVGKALFYKISVPAGQTVLVTATPSATLDPVLRFIASCTATACERFDDTASAGAPEIGHWANTGAAATDIIVAVSPYTRGADGTFDISATYVPSASGATCDGAALVPAGTTLRAQDLHLSETGAESRCLTSAAGYELFYRVSVPASQRLTVTATPTGTWNPVIRVLASCAATTCLASGDAATAGAVETLTYANAGAAPVEVVVAVGSDLAMRSGTFDLALVVAP
ncbi:MAG: hypothetical protein WCJ30_25090 [Deltaproteobacteria bacterium]